MIDNLFTRNLFVRNHLHVVSQLGQTMYFCVCVCACVHACVCACVCVHACMHVCMHACVSVYVHTLWTCFAIVGHRTCEFPLPLSDARWFNSFSRTSWSFLCFQKSIFYKLSWKQCQLDHWAKSLLQDDLLPRCFLLLPCFPFHLFNKSRPLPHFLLCCQNGLRGLRPSW